MDLFKQHFIKQHSLTARSAVLDAAFKAGHKAPKTDETYLVAFILEEDDPSHYNAFIMVGSLLEKYDTDPKLDLGFLEQALHADVSDRSLRTMNHPNAIWLKGDGREMIPLKDTDYYWINASTIHSI